MKHLFTIHSPLTFLVAYSVIEYLKLDKQKVILISQNFSVPIQGFTVVPAFQDKLISTFQKALNLNVPKHYDRYLDEILDDEDFIAYIDLMAIYQKILITHKRCKEFHFLEEGNSAYMAWDNLTDLTWSERRLKYRNKFFFDRSAIRSLIRIFRGFNVRLLSIPYHYMAFSNFEKIKFFSFSNNAFFNAPKTKKVLLKPNPESGDIQRMAANMSLEGETIWIDGSNARYTGLSEEFYYKAIDVAIPKLKDKKIIKKNVFVKLRPGLKNITNKYIVKALTEHDIQVEILPDNMVLESLFITSNSCNVIGTLTAALEYAYVFGHRAISIYSLFEEQPQTFFDRMDGFWENVELLT